MIKSEDQILALLDEYFKYKHSGLLLGRGDDCAELYMDRPLAVSTDLFLEGVHFRRSYFTPEEIGHKALAVNLSDLAAAGAAPLGFSLGLICPPGQDEADLRGVFSGMAALAERSQASLVGGDISSGPSLGFCISVMGYTPAVAEPFLRRDPRPGELLFVVSPGGRCNLGLARHGLMRLEAEGRAATGAYPASTRALLLPEPLLLAGGSLAYQAADYSKHMALMDLSDGLARDLPRFVGAFGAELDFDPAILHPELGPHPELGENALELALSGGDDYLLLGAVAEDAIPLLKLPPEDSLHIIGRVSRSPGVSYRGRPLGDFHAEAFDHFWSKHE